MSIFPKRVKKGDSIVFHLGLKRPLRKPLVTDVKLMITSPSNERIEILQKRSIVFPFNSINKEREQIYFNHPSMMIANYIRDNLNDAILSTKLQGVLKRYKSHKHNYYPMLIDDRFAPGKYHLELECYVNGRCLGSLTKEHDYFYVDELEINHINRKKQGKGYQYTIVNKSTAKTPIRILSYDAENKIEEAYLVLAPLEEKRLETNSNTSFITYASDNGIIALNEDSKQTHYVRNQHMKWVKSDEKIYILHSNKEDFGLEVKGSLMTAWEQLEVAKSEQSIIEISDKASFELLREMELIQSINF